MLLIIHKLFMNINHCDIFYSIIVLQCISFINMIKFYLPEEMQTQLAHQRIIVILCIFVDLRLESQADNASLLHIITVNTISSKARKIHSIQIYTKDFKILR